MPVSQVSRPCYLDSWSDTLEQDKVSVVTEMCVCVCVKTRYTIGHSIMHHRDTHIWKERDTAGIGLPRTHAHRKTFS